MLPTHRNTPKSMMPPFKRYLTLLVLGLLAIAALNIVPSIFSRSAIQEKLLLEEELRRVEDELKVTSQQLNALKQAASKGGSEVFYHEKDGAAKEEDAEAPEGQEGTGKDKGEEQRNAEIVTHKQLQSAKDEVLQLEAELRRLKTEKSEEVGVGAMSLPEHFGQKVNSRLIKVSFEKEEPEYKKTIYRSTNDDSGANELIVLTSIAHSNSYGADRTFKDFIETVKTIEFERTMATLGLLVGSKEEYKAILEYMDKNEEDTFFSKVVVIHAQFLEDLYKLDREVRHSLSVQKERRRSISRARNFLITNALGDETYSLCLDADMVETPEDLLRLFVNSGKDIVVPRIRQGGAENYDFNSWAGARKKPSAEEAERLDNNDADFLFVPGPEGASHMHDFVNEEKWANTGKRDFAVKLDSVGGAVLLLKSEIFKQGVMFPPFYVVGTSWDRLEGYDGIETEGLCYQARTIGYTCWGFPNVVAYHDIELQDG